MAVAIFTCRAYARIGLLGNPSDNYYGKTLSVSIENFFAEVILSQTDNLGFVPHPLHDGGVYSSLEALQHKLPGEGYSGGIRLLKTELRRKNFTISYETNIPRQSGLAGSSAIVCAAINCLIAFYGVSDRIPVLLRPGLVLAAEQELGITAGLQDRVIQVFGGCVYMDFDRNLMQRSGGIGRYQSIDPRKLPPLWLITAASPSDSGVVHNDVRRRWEAGDQRVEQAMHDFASFAEQSRACLERPNKAKLARFASLMNANFDKRREIFGDAALGELNLKMVATARSVGAAAKFTGSGGAVVAYCPDGQQQEEQLRAACTAEGFQVVPVDIKPPIYVVNDNDVDMYMQQNGL